MIGDGTPGSLPALCGVLALGLAWGPVPSAHARVAAPEEIAAEPPADAGGDEPPDDPGLDEADPADGAPDESLDGTEDPANGDPGERPEDLASEAEPGAEPERPPPQFGRPGDESTDVGPAPRSMDDAGAPGGYWGATDTKEREPSDGRRRILIGSIVLPLGVIATVTGAVATYFTVPEHCVDRLGSIGIEAKRSRCGGLYALNIVRTSYGSLMIVTGAVFLALGLRDRKANREWHKHHSRRGGPRFAVTGGPGGLTLRF